MQRGRNERDVPVTSLAQVADWSITQFRSTILQYRTGEGTCARRSPGHQHGSAETNWDRPESDLIYGSSSRRFSTAESLQLKRKLGHSSLVSDEQSAWTRRANRKFPGRATTSIERARRRKPTRWRRRRWEARKEAESMRVWHISELGQCPPSNLRGFRIFQKHGLPFASDADLSAPAPGRLQSWSSMSLLTAGYVAESAISLTSRTYPGSPSDAHLSHSTSYVRAYVASRRVECVPQRMCVWWFGTSSPAIRGAWRTREQWRVSRRWRARAHWVTHFGEDDEDDEGDPRPPLPRRARIRARRGTARARRGERDCCRRAETPDWRSVARRKGESQKTRTPCTARGGLRGLLSTHRRSLRLPLREALPHLPSPTQAHLAILLGPVAGDWRETYRVLLMRESLWDMYLTTILSNQLSYKDNSITAYIFYSVIYALTYSLM